MNKKDPSTRLKDREMFDKLINERSNKIKNLRKQINCNDLTYYFKTTESNLKYFTGFRFPLNFLRSKRDCGITPEKVKKCKKTLNQILIP